MPKFRFPSRFLGAKIALYGQSLTAIFPLPYGRGRLRKTAPPTPAGLQALQAWIATTAANAAADRPSLTPAETADALAALALLPPGVSLADAARAYAATIARASPVTIATARAEYLAALAAANRRPGTLAAARYRLSSLDPYADHLTTDLDAATAERLVRLHRAPVTQNGVRSACASFFAFCIRRNYALSNPFASVPTAAVDRAPPALYKPADVARLFAAAESSPTSRRLIPFLALAFFAGIRSSGLYRLAAADLGPEWVRVSGWADKTRRGYIVPVSPTLRAWIDAYPLAPSAPVAPLSPRQMLAAIRKLHAAAHVKRIPNGARHSFASYLYAQSGDAAKTAAALGHFGNTATLVNHYRALATPADADAFFAISPRKLVDKLEDS